MSYNRRKNVVIKIAFRIHNRDTLVL